MKKIKHLLILVSFLLLLNCIPFSNPLTNPKDSMIDNRLLGIWQSTQAEDNYFYLILSSGEKTYNLFVFDKNYKIKNDELEGHLVLVTIINDEYYLSIYFKESDRYIIVKYRIENDLISCYSINRDYLKEAIKQGNIKGYIDYKRDGIIRESIYITASSEELYNFVKKDKIDKLFSKDEFVLRRLKIK
jgi:hypothetical protein